MCCSDSVDFSYLISKSNLNASVLAAIYEATGFTINVRKNGEAQHDHIKNQS